MPPVKSYAGSGCVRTARPSASPDEMDEMANCPARERMSSRALRLRSWRKDRTLGHCHLLRHTASMNWHYVGRSWTPHSAHLDHKTVRESQFHRAHSATQFTGMKCIWFVLRNNYPLHPNIVCKAWKHLSASWTEMFFSLQARQKSKKTSNKLARCPWCPTQWYVKTWFCKLASEHNLLPGGPLNLSAAGASQHRPPQDLL